MPLSPLPPVGAVVPDEDTVSTESLPPLPPIGAVVPPALTTDPVPDFRTENEKDESGAAVVDEDVTLRELLDDPVDALKQAGQILKRDLTDPTLLASLLTMKFGPRVVRAARSGSVRGPAAGALRVTGAIAESPIVNIIEPRFASVGRMMTRAADAIAPRPSPSAVPPPRLVGKAPTVNASVLQALEELRQPARPTSVTMPPHVPQVPTGGGAPYVRPAPPPAQMAPAPPTFTPAEPSSFVPQHATQVRPAPLRVVPEGAGPARTPSAAARPTSAQTMNEWQTSLKQTPAADRPKFTAAETKAGTTLIARGVSGAEAQQVVLALRQAPQTGSPTSSGPATTTAAPQLNAFERWMRGQKAGYDALGPKMREAIQKAKLAPSPEELAAALEWEQRGVSGAKAVERILTSRQLKKSAAMKGQPTTAQAKARVQARNASGRWED